MARFLAKLALLMSLAGTVGACADDDDSNGVQRDAALSGSVRDGQTGQGLGGARVEFLADTGEKASESTNKSGRFGLVVRAMSPLGRLTVSKPGYRTRVVSVFLDENEVSVDIDLLKQ